MTKMTHAPRRPALRLDRPWKATLRLLLQGAVGAACLAASFAWATAQLADYTAPAREALDAVQDPLPAPATMAVVRLDDWPEIKDGVPALKGTEPLEPVGRADPSGRTDSAERPEPVVPPSPSAPIKADGVAAEPERPSISPSDVPGPVRADRTTDPNPAETVVGIAPASPTKSPDADPAAAAKPAVASAPAATRAAGLELRQQEAPRREVRAEPKAGVSAPALAARPASTARADARGIRKTEAKASRTEAKASRPARKRVASAAPAAPAPSDDPVPAAPEARSEAKPESDGVRVLGVTLPGGRRIKECLLDFRC